MLTGVLTNARLVLPDEVVDGHVHIRGGRIEAVGSGNAWGEDCAGDYLLPGLVELHTDHLEAHISPRPGVRWNLAAAIQAHDAQIAGSGITTVFDALRVGIEADGATDSATSRKIADEIAAAQDADRLRADHRIHLRCEVSSETVLDGFSLFDGVPVALISLMDHTPGQRQFASLTAYQTYFQPEDVSVDEFEAVMAGRVAEAARVSDLNRRALAAIARERDLIVASHDDATEAHVADAVRDGVTVAEFPTTLQAARQSREAGMKVLMGGPNLVRGGSHSGNASALDLADEGALDIVSSDYVPFSLLQSAFVLAALDGWSLPRAVATVTSAPARAVALKDRGVIAEGLLADLVRVRWDGPGAVPVVRGVWREGVRVA